MTGYFKPHVSIQINSRKRTTGTIENFTTRLSHQIKFSQKASKSYWLRVENILLPKSYYDIDGNFNVLQVVENGGGGPYTLTITVPVGNYTILELLTELETLLDAASLASGDSNTYTLSYSEITNKVTFRFDGGSSTEIVVSTIATASTINPLLGIGKADTTTITGDDNNTYLYDGVDLGATNCVDLHVNSYITIETDISSENYYDEDGQIHIGVRVPMTVDRSEVQHFENHEGHMTKINSRSPLSIIGFKLKDEYNNVKDLCKVDYTCDLAIYELTELHKN